MKKFAGVAFAILLFAMIAGGCGQSYEAEASTLFVLKDGKIISTDVEAFDENTYDKEGLTSYVEEAVEAYNSENGKDSVKVKRLDVKEGTATLILEYASAADYAGFNGIELYTGSVAEALAAGYSFDVEFAKLTDGNASVCKVDDIVGNGDYKVVIIKGNTNVHVNGTIAYASTMNTTYVDDSTIAIQEGTNLLGQAVSEQATEYAEEVIGDTQSTEGEESLDAAVSDNELLLDTEESDVVQFEFDEEPVDNTQMSEFSQVYTYIIYQ